MLPSVRHYLIVDTDKRIVIHHRRDGERRIIVQYSATARSPSNLQELVIDVRGIFDGL